MGLPSQAYTIEKARRPIMILERARELISQQLACGGGYNRNPVRVILSEVLREHGQASVDRLIDDTDLGSAFGLQQETDFSKATN